MREPAAPPNDAAELLVELEQLGVQLRARGEKLGIRAPKGVLTPALKARLARHKGQLLELLGAAPGNGDGDPEPAAPLSFSQQRLWLLDQLRPANAAYNIALIARLDGPLRRRVLRRALAEIVRRHQVLRTTFGVTGDGPRQVVAAPTSPEDVLDQSDVDSTAELERRLAEEIARPFDLERGPLLRGRLWRGGVDRWILVLTCHHNVADAWSMTVLARELQALYRAFAGGTPSPLPEPEVQYADFARRQRHRYTAGAAAESLAYWKRQLTPLPPVLELSADRPRPATQSFRGDRLQVPLPQPSSDALEALSRDREVTLFMTLAATFQALLHRLSGARDLAIGIPILGRDERRLEDLVGFFVGTLVLRIRLDGDLPFGDLLRRVRTAADGAYAHADLPFEQLVAELRPDRDLSHTPIFQVMFNLADVSGLRLDLPQLATKVEVTMPGSRFDLTLYALRDGSELRLELAYNTDLFDRSTAERLLRRYRRLLAAATEDPERPLAMMPLLSRPEAQQLLVEWNDAPGTTGRGFAHRLLAARAASQPRAMAVTAGGQRLTYGELAGSVERLARRLERLGVGPEVAVGICLERSPAAVVAMFAVLEAGGAYVPLDPAHPPGRLRSMLRDARARMILTRSSLADRLPRFDGRTVCLDLDDDGAPGATAAAVSGRNLAYVVYTSGSTGRPKGVMIAHRGLVTYLRFLVERYALGPGQVVLQVAPFGFDISVRDLVAPLAGGARVVIAGDDDVRDPEALLDLIEADGVTCIPGIVATLFHRLIEAAANRPAPAPSLRLVLVGGEALQLADVRRARSTFGRHLRVVNQYGPTEATGASLSQPLPPITGRGIAALGRPNPYVDVALADARLRPVPIGVPGEILLRSVGLARGYARRPAVTAAAFVPDPGSRSPGGRLYRTGDLGRHRPDGRLEFLGRRDHQVKIRGFRIEPGESESHLERHPAVREAAVVVREIGGEPGLVAFYAPRPDRRPRAGELRRHLEAALPDYLRPAHYVELAELPINANGKVDRRRLPEVRAERPELDTGLAPPRSPLEARVAAAWAETLDLPRIGIHDNFFQLGGHSLLAIRLVERLRRDLAVELPVRDLFEQPTVAELAARLAAAMPMAEPLEPLERVSRGGELPLSATQERLWFLDQLEGASAAYNMPTALDLDGDLEVAALAAALAEIVRRHEVLRARFPSAGGRARLEIKAPARGRLPVVELSALAAEDRRAEVRRRLAEEAERAFDLARGPLFRALLLRLGRRRHVLAASFHHIVADGWSLQVFADELGSLYGAGTAGEPSPLAPIAVQYLDWSAWQRRWLASGALTTQLDFWQRRLGGVPVLRLPTDRPRPAVLSTRGAVRKVALPATLTGALRRLSQEAGASLFMTLLAGFASLLGRLADQRDLALGTPVANRQRPEIEGLIGPFLNTLALRVDLAGDPSFSELLERVRDLTLDAYQHQDMPFEKLVDALQPERDLSHTPLYQAMIVFHNDAPAAPEMAGLTAERLAPPRASAQTDLSLALWQDGERLVGVAELARDLFDETSVDRWLGHYRTLLADAAADPGLRLSELCRLPPAERHQLLVEWSATRSQPAPHPVHELVAGRAAEAPDALALVAGDAHWTYGELWRRASTLAQRLRARGVGPETVVALMAGRTPEMPVAILGILAAGGAYLPLDPDYPAERLLWLLADAGARLLLADPGSAAVAGTLGAAGVDLVTLDARATAPAADTGGLGVTGRISLHPVYVIYTSGSTGRPKGVVIEHRALANHTASAAGEYAVEAGDRVLQFASLSFDTSAEEIFPCLTRGATLVFRDQLPGSPEQFFGRLTRERITVLNLPTAFWHELAAGTASLPPALRLVIIGGERALGSRLAEWRRLAGSAPPKLFNTYGPTEGTIVATRCELTSTAGTADPAIGRPISGVTTRVLDRHLRPVPVGVVGELALGGAGIARGYLGRPARTAAAFVPDPFAGGRARAPGSRVYRTGDLVRARAHGRLAYVGRADHQVKVRGFRIEPGEIEAALAHHPTVTEAVVVRRDDARGHPRLIAYVATPGDASPPTVGELRAFLKATLPDHMIPAAFVPLAELPHTTSGKIDRRALPAPGPARPRLEASYAEPASAEETILAEIWARLLQLERVGARDNFFELGGDSILSIQIVAQARERGLRLVPQDLFRHQTVADLAAVARRLPAAGTDDATPRGPVTGPAPLTPIQRWFFGRGLPEPGHYHWRTALAVRGPLPPEVLEQALEHLLHHHDALRLAFPPQEPETATAGGGRRQVFTAPGGRPPYLRVDLSRLSSAARERAATAAARTLEAPFDLTSPPLLRLADLDPGADGDRRLVLVVHHLLVDAVSWQILLDDLETACRQLAAGQPVALPARTTPARTWAELLAAHAEDEATRRELPYWLAQLDGSTPLPVDVPGAENRLDSEAMVTVALGEESTAALLRRAAAAYRTRVDEILLTALARAFGRWTGDRALTVELEGHGREQEIFPGVDLTRTVGWFTTVFPVRLDLRDAGDDGAALKTVKETLRAVPRRGIGYGLLRELAGAASDPLRALPPPEVSFNYLGRLDPTAGAGAGSRRLEPTASLRRLVQGNEGSRSHLLEIGCGITEGRLQVAWAFSRGLHRRATVETLARGFLAELEALIRHCLSPRAGGCTPSDFPLAGLDQPALDRLFGDDRDVEDIYPAAPTQEAMIYFRLYAPASRAYFGEISLLLEGALDVAALHRIWQRLGERYAVMRTAFVWDQERLFQVVRAGVETPWEEEDWRQLSAAEQQQRLEEQRTADRVRDYDFGRPPLSRLRLVRLADKVHVLIWCQHHSLLDGWSLQIILRDFVELYRAAEQDREARLEPVTPYRRYLAWLATRERAGAEAFWRRSLRGFRAATPLPYDRVIDHRPGQAEDMCMVRLPVSERREAELASWARRHRVTPNTIFQAAWALTLAHACGRDDVVFGATLAGRPPELAGVESIVGLFITTSPARARIRPSTPLTRWLGELQMATAEMQQHAHHSLFDIAEWSDVPNGQPLFENVVLFQNYPELAGRDLLTPEDDGGLEIRGAGSREETSYPLNLYVIPASRLSVSLAYDGRRFDATTVSRIRDAVANLIASFLAHPERRLGEHSLLGAGARHQVLTEWNDTAAGREPMPVRARFAAQARRTPEAVAVACGDERLSYRELDRRTDALARHLRRLGLGPEQRVGILMVRSPELIVALLGVLKAGAAYLPLDPLYPTDRLAFILDEAEVGVVLTLERLVGDLPPAPAVHAICLDNDEVPGTTDRGTSDRGTAAPELPPPENLAGSSGYVIYTSGSTGQPKGVMIAESSLAAYVDTAVRRFALAPGDRVLQFASISFDTSAEEIFPCLASGATLVLRSERMIESPAVFLDTCDAWGISVLDLPTAYWHEAMSALAAGEARLPPTLRLMIIGGESAGAAQVAAWRRYAAGVELLNTYGPTEATIVATARSLASPRAGASPRITIGRAIRRLRTHVLDRRGAVAGIRAAGELCLGGAGVARGYLRRPALSAERFVPDPFAGRPGRRLYRTGDRVRRLPDGDLEFLGRLDHQVKLRGLRIELGEVEAALARHPAVAEAAALVQGAPAPAATPAASQRLIAYLAPRAGVEPASSRELRAFLKQTLPFYMLPSSFVTLDALPLTSNRKVDRRALADLPLPAAARVPLDAEAVAPRDDLEAALAKLWAELLGVTDPGVRTDFFDLGGQSLMAVRLMAEIERRFGVELPLAALFKDTTIEGLSRRIRERRPQHSSLLVAIRATGSRPPFFCVHPAAGHVLCYRDLARHLGDDQPFYGLESQGCDGRAPFHRDVESMAAAYLEGILAHQPDGPYHLGGWSMGGLVAFEIARRLAAEGRQVALLVVLDTVAPGLAAEPASQRLTGFRRRLRDAGEWLGLHPTRWRARWHDFFRFYRQMDGARRRHFQRLYDNNVRVMGLYRPRPYGGRIVLIKPRRAPALGDPTDGWGELAASGVDVRRVPGDHYSMMREPNVESLAAELRRHLA